MSRRDDKICARNKSGLSRRSFIEGAGLALTSGMLPGWRGGTSAFTLPRTPVMTYDTNLGRPYLDLTGRGMPYHPPAGARSGEMLAAADNGGFINLHQYL